MRLITYTDSGKELVGILTEDNRVLNVAESGVPCDNMIDVITMKAEYIRELEVFAAVCGERGKAWEEIKVEAPIPVPCQDVICLGLNYQEHAKEAAGYGEEAFGHQSEAAVYFSKRVSRASAWDADIPAYEELTDSLDYEVELGVILNKDCKNINPEDVQSCIFGYTIINDVSARDIQQRHKQWYLGKSLDGFLPMGPCIVTADEIGFPVELSICCKVNGAIRQESNTAMMIHKVAETISELSRYMTLKAGTIVAMGTPSGVGMGMTPAVFLKKGDAVVCEIEKIGMLCNRIV